MILFKKEKSSDFSFFCFYLLKHFEFCFQNRPKSPSIEKFLDTSSTQPKSHLPLQETLSSDSIKNQKRPAPKPPSPKDDLSQRFAAVLSDMDSCKPDQQEIENGSVRRISRSTENLLEFITNQDQKNQLSAEGLEEISVPEPVPRRSLSLSQDSLVPCDAGLIYFYFVSFFKEFL